MTTSTNNLANPCEPENFAFRNKFEKLLTDENRCPITSAFQKFCGFDEKEAILHLWHLTTGHKFMDTLDELDLSIDFVGDLTAFRNELRYQYSLRHPGFLDINAPEYCLTAFDALKNKADSIVATVVYQHCQAHASLDASEIDRTLYLLGSDREDFQLGGIRNLSNALKDEDARYLLPFSKQIGDLLRTLYTNAELTAIVQGTPHTSAEDCSHLPFYFGETDKAKKAPLATINSSETAGEDAPNAVLATANANEGTKREATSTAETNDSNVPNQDLPAHSGNETASVPAQDEDDTKTFIYGSAGFEVLNATQILRNQEALLTLFSSEALSILLQLRDKHFDLNEVVGKQAKIMGFIQASNSLFG